LKDAKRKNFQTKQEKKVWQVETNIFPQESGKSTRRIYLLTLIKNVYNISALLLDYCQCQSTLPYCHPKLQVYLPMFGESGTACPRFREARRTILEAKKLFAKQCEILSTS
jgi:hypothetical protein